jgi:hypothetical protein
VGDPQTIQELSEEIFRRVAEAARKGLTDQVVMLASLAKNCESALKATSRLEADVEGIKQELRNMDHPTPSVASATISRSSAVVRHNQSRKTGGRQRGREKRDNWVGEAKRRYSVDLRQLGEVTYETASGKRVGIPYASEAPQRTYPWWLGLPDEQPYYVVLLCETTDGELFDFVLDHRCVSQIWRSLSRDSNHHVKFHVRRSGPNWELKLKDGPVIQLNEFHRSGAASIVR